MRHMSSEDAGKGEAVLSRLVRTDSSTFNISAPPPGASSAHDPKTAAPGAAAISDPKKSAQGAPPAGAAATASSAHDPKTAPGAEASDPKKSAQEAASSDDSDPILFNPDEGLLGHSATDKIVPAEACKKCKAIISRVKPLHFPFVAHKVMPHELWPPCRGPIASLSWDVLRVVVCFESTSGKWILQWLKHLGGFPDYVNAKRPMSPAQRKAGHRMFDVTSGKYVMLHFFCRVEPGEYRYIMK